MICYTSKNRLFLPFMIIDVNVELQEARPFAISGRSGLLNFRSLAKLGGNE